MILFDTDACLSLLAGNAKIVEKYGSLMDEVCVPALCVPELFYAAEQSKSPEENRRTIEKFLATVRVLHPDNETYRYAARLQNKLVQRGFFVPQNDVLVFSTSRVFSARLVTLHAGRYRFT